MKKVLVLFNTMLVLALFSSGLFVENAQAKQDRDRWQKVHADWPGYGYYKVSPNGVVHEKWACNENWRNCAGSATYYPISKFKNPVTGTPCGENIGTITWGGTMEYSDDQADVSDFLVIDETYWFCDTVGQDVFRGPD